MTSFGARNTVESRLFSIRGLAGSSAVGLVLACGGAGHAADAPTTLQLGPAKIEDSPLSDKNALNKKPAGNQPTTSIQDTPQAVTVVDGETMKQQATTTLGEALRNVPGITIAIGEGGTLAGDQFKIRGFDAKDDVYLDGLRDFAAYTRDSFAYQEVQVMKGPSGLMFGRGTTGGAINTVSKTPTLRTGVSAQVEGGNGAHARATADANYRLTDTSAVRIALMYTNTGVVDRDHVFSHRWGIAPSVGFGIDTDTVFTASLIHQHSNNRQDYGIPVAQPVGSIFAVPASEFGVPRTTFMGYRTDQDNNDADIVTAKFSHVVNEWLTIQNDTRVAWYSRYFQYTSVDRCDTAVATNFCSNAVSSANPLTAQAGIGGGGPYQQDSSGWQDTLTANAVFNLGTLRNQVIVGGDISHQKAERTIFAYTLPTLAQFTYTLNDHTRSRANIGRSFYNPTYEPPPGYAVVLPTPANVANTNATPTTVFNSTGKANDYAFFATDRLWFSDALSLIAGVRVDRYIVNYASTTVAGVVTRARAPSTLANPRGSLVYEPDQNTTVYFSYGKSAVPQGTSVVGTPTPISTANQALEPEKSETFEIGAKYSLWDGKLGLAGSVFQVKKDNATLTDPNTGLVTLQSGQKQRVRGFEVSATGSVTEDLGIIAAYTYLDPIVTHDLSCGGTPAVCKPNLFTIGKMITFVPRHAASLWADYKMTGVLKGLSVGGGIVYQSRLHNAYTLTGAAPNPTGIARYVLFPETVQLDAVAAHQFGGRYTLQLNVNNITNRLNYSQSFGNRGTPAPGRTVLASIEARF
ncbi:MAG: TonB-dependent receptor [Rhodospirillaceae bacterium]